MLLHRAERLLIPILCAIATACGGGGGNPPASPEPVAQAPAADACSVESRKDFVSAVATDWYLWYDELAPVDAEDFATADEYLAALTAPLAEDFRDPGFSYLTTRSEDQANFLSRRYAGFGFRYAIDDAGRYLVSDVFEDGPAHVAGFRRGAEIVAVDAGAGFVSMRAYEERGASVEEVFGESVEGVERVFRLRLDDATFEAVLAKAELEVPPLALAPRLIERPGLDPVAYLHLRNFTRSAIPALDEAFAELGGSNVTDFIVDLRYNGGGLVDVSAHVMDLLGGAVADGEVAFTIRHNDKQRAEDAAYAFEQLAESALPLRIAFITSEATASASESLVNSLAATVDVVLVGSDTSGKAVGQYAFDQSGCETRLRLVAFESVNGEGLGGYYTGLVDTGRFTLCAVEDRYSGAFGTGDDALTAGALAWLNEGQCPREIAGSATPSSNRALRRGPAPISAFERPDRRSLWVQ